MRHEPLRYKEYARELRQKQTDGERAMWNAVRGRRFLGLKFRRQREIGHYIVDFYCEELRFAIEMDGEGHMSVEGFAGDAVRTHELQARGITVTRVENAEFLVNPVKVLERLERLVRGLIALRG